MKTFYVMFAVFAVLLLGAPLASAQDDWPGCPWGNTYSPTEHGFIAECFWQPAANAATPKSAGLAAPVPAVIPEQRLSCLSWHDAYDPMTHAFVLECLSWSTNKAAAPKTAGMAQLAPAVKFDPCGFSEQLDPLLDPRALACLSQSFPAAKAASKPAGLAAPVPAVIPEQRLSCLSWHDAYDPMTHAFVLECLSWSTNKAAAPKTAGMAQLAPAVKFDPCGFSEQLDPLLDPRALACLSQSVPAAKAASKPAGLAAPVPAVIPEQRLPCLPWGDAYDPQTMLSRGPECVSQPADNSAASKTAGLAKLTPVEGVVSCRAGENLDALALACLSQSFPAAKAASKPSGLAAPAPAVISEQGWPGCPWGDAYDPMVQGFIAECFWRPTDNGAALKPAGLAKLAPVQEQFGPCGSSGESPDPLVWAQACQR